MRIIFSIIYIFIWGCKKINREGGGKGYDERKDVGGGRCDRGYYDE